MLNSGDKKGAKNRAMAQVRAVERILRTWDPINVSPGVEAPADEYDSYAPRILSMIKSGCTQDELASHLEHLASEVMGLGGSSRSHSLEFAGKLISELRKPDTEA
jgi:hypothetical protein